MQINPISFGKIVKVNAPYETAQRLALITNYPSDTNKELQKQIKKYSVISKTVRQLLFGTVKTQAIF